VHRACVFIFLKEGKKEEKERERKSKRCKGLDDDAELDV